MYVGGQTAVQVKWQTEKQTNWTCNMEFWSEFSINKVNWPEAAQKLIKVYKKSIFLANLFLLI